MVFDNDISNDSWQTGNTPCPMISPKSRVGVSLEKCQIAL